MTIETVLASLASAGIQLNDLDTKLCELITKTEELLRNYVGTRISLNVGERVIAFGKINDKWRLIVGTEVLLSCPRQVRSDVFTAGHIEALIHGAVDQLDAQIAQRREAIVAAELIVAALTSGTKS